MAEERPADEHRQERHVDGSQDPGYDARVMTGDDVALAALYVRIDELTELLQDVCAALPSHMEQQEQALVDGIAGAEAALQWLRCEGVRAAGMERWLQLLEDATSDAAIESPPPSALAACAPTPPEVVTVCHAPQASALKTKGDRQIEQLAAWLRREQESRARERSRLYNVIANLHLAMREAQVRASEGVR